MVIFFQCQDHQALDNIVINDWDGEKQINRNEPDEFQKTVGRKKE